MRWIACGRNCSYSCKPIFLKLCKCFCYGLKMCNWFWVYPPVICYQRFLLFRLIFCFQVQITIRIDTLWVQHFETMHTCFAWSVDVHVVLGLSSYYFLSNVSSRYFFSTFFHFFDLFFFSSQITIRKDTLWAQLLLEFSTDHFETIHTCSTWSVDVHVVSG